MGGVCNSNSSCCRSGEVDTDELSQRTTTKNLKARMQSTETEADTPDKGQSSAAKDRMEAKRQAQEKIKASRYVNDAKAEILQFFSEKGEP